MKRHALYAGFTACTALAVLASVVSVTHAEAPTNVTPTLLARGTLDAFNVRSDPRGPVPNFRAHSTQPVDLVVRQHDYQAGGSTGWHTHPGPILITVTRGTLTYYESDDPCTPHTVHAGQSFVDTGHGHLVRNLSSSTAQDISVIVAPVGGAFRTNIDPPAVSC
ncbi:MAG TPA: cupin domain-containing protein [Mycobacteriales bacterium]|nr:cupin domain-containing protein [Mycobacteriales bacterium]